MSVRASREPVVRFIAAAFQIAAPLDSVRRMSVNLDVTDVFEAVRLNLLTPEQGAMVLQVRREALMPWWVRVWEAIWP